MGSESCTMLWILRQPWPESVSKSFGLTNFAVPSV
jgi:hypothetical protein